MGSTSVFEWSTLEKDANGRPGPAQLRRLQDVEACGVSLSSPVALFSYHINLHVLRLQDGSVRIVSRSAESDPSQSQAALLPGLLEDFQVTSMTEGGGGLIAFVSVDGALALAYFGYEEKQQFSPFVNAQRAALLHLPPGVKAVKAACADYMVAVQAEDGRMFTVGFNAFGQLGAGGCWALKSRGLFGCLAHYLSCAWCVCCPHWSPYSLRPVLVEGALRGRKVVSVSTGSEHFVAVDSEGGVFSWGRGGPWLGLGRRTRFTGGPVGVHRRADADARREVWSAADKPMRIQGGDLGEGRCVRCFAGGHGSACLTERGDLLTWGRGAATFGDEFELPHLDSRFNEVVGGRGVREFALSDRNAALLLEDDRVLHWNDQHGYDVFQLGRGDGSSGIVSVSVDDYSGFIVKKTQTQSD
uniref:Uncharacterized protein n=1 Tax=Chromera velia CCMP2878 TaxID=1169474 RepID=A0A0G4HIT6_9ALVE|eukprot:Cvel_28046.t1-p1 / transcript=Cvel_28046.t1 / gene=Cvel_28046 / organism=Chromera_velia_CCMP2878 / gene_product=hypothetical protein / transcript_product=hypothetical protein / location=Cvel_scaffold3602:12275-13513(-) / protein_length=413 / sequence_SO=supercontig / SO=protein_coding / is_pseudo=false